MTAPFQPDTAYTERDLARRFAVPIATVRRWLDDGAMECFMFGGARMVQRRRAMAWLHIYAPERDAEDVFKLPPALFGPNVAPGEDPGRKAPDHPDRGTRHFETYGLSSERLEQLWRNQNGVCAMCSAAGTMTKNGMVGLVIDHDHVSGEVRGLLCTRCNTVLGGYEAAIRLNVHSYLRSPPAKRLGIVALHRDVRE